MKRSDLQPGDCPEFYQGYIETLPEDYDLLDLIARQLQNFPQFIGSIPPEKWDYRYAEDKWTVAEVMVHILDAERVFQYRALRFGRKDTTPLPGYDHDLWVPQSGAGAWTLQQYGEAYKIVRTSTLQLFETFSQEDLRFKGTASGVQVGLGALGFIICGHQRHHRNILRSRYFDA